MKYARSEAGSLCLVHLRKSHDNQSVAHFALMRRRAIEAADVATALS